MTTTLLPQVAEPATPEKPADPTVRKRWERPALLALLAATAVLYIWGLGESGWANSYYTAAVQAASESWKAWFFGSFDAANFITVDKTPASLWVMGLSARIFGFSTWSMLVPQALLGVAAVGVLYATVRRWFGPAAGLLAGAVLALTPVAVLMFRFNNPDALLVLLLTLGAWAMTRAVERGSTKWIMLAGAFVGFGFLAKMLQALLVVPAFAIVYLIAAPGSIGRRIWQTLLAGVAMVVAAGWWLVTVELWPADSRPYIGGSQSNSILELTLGYNGLDRITGEQTGSVGGGGGNGGGWGSTGWTRMFGTDIGGQVAWLLPAALILLVVGLVLTARRPRTDRTRAALLLWGGWLLTTGLVFSFMAGIFHQYYTVALAPAVGALVGIGGALLWRRRHHWAAVATLAGTVVVTAIWAFTILSRSATWYPWLRTLILIGGIVAAVGLLGTLLAPERVRRYAAGAAAALAVSVALAGPLAYSLNTAATAHTGSIVTAGPTVAGGGFGRPGGGTGGRRDGGAAFPGGGQALPGGGQALPGGGQGAPNGGTLPNGGTPPTGGMAGGGGRGAGMGGLLNATQPNSALVTALLQDADSYTWVVATVGANNAAGYQLATGKPVMAIGGFNGSDASPTLAQFQAYVKAGQIHYFAGGSGFRANGGSNYGAQIAAWVAGNYPTVTVGGTTLYDLSAR